MQCVTIPARCRRKQFPTTDKDSPAFIFEGECLPQPLYGLDDSVLLKIDPAEFGQEDGVTIQFLDDFGDTT